jgi:hypothetical protein
MDECKPLLLGLSEEAGVGAPGEYDGTDIYGWARATPSRDCYCSR